MAHPSGVVHPTPDAPPPPNPDCATGGGGSVRREPVSTRGQTIASSAGAQPHPPGGLAVIGRGGIHMGGRLGSPGHLIPRIPQSVRQLGMLADHYGVRQVWVHAEALEAMHLPAQLVLPARGRGSMPHPFTEDRADWRTRSDPGLKGSRYWYREGGDGFDVNVPAYSPEGRDPFARCETPVQLLATVRQFERATDYVAWKGTGAATSDSWLRARLRKRLQATEVPVDAHEAALAWRRDPRRGESPYHYCHALDLNLAYAAAASSLPLPMGAPIHLDWPGYLEGRPAVYLVERENKSRWVTAPTMERLAKQGVEPLEAHHWPSSGRSLRPWYEMLRDARAALLEVGGPALKAVKLTCQEGLGSLASRDRVGGLADPLFQPYWDWAVIAEVRERLLDRVRALEVEPVAIDVDCLYFLSSRASPSALGLFLGLPVGDGLGQFKAAGSCSGRDARDALALPTTKKTLDRLRELVEA